MIEGCGSGTAAVWLMAVNALIRERSKSRALNCWIAALYEKVAVCAAAGLLAAAREIASIASKIALEAEPPAGAEPRAAPRRRRRRRG